MKRTKPDPTMTRRAGLVRASKAAEELGVHPRTVCRWVRDGVIEGRVLAGYYYVPRAVLDELVRMHRSNETIV